MINGLDLFSAFPPTLGTQSALLLKEPVIHTVIHTPVSTNTEGKLGEVSCPWTQEQCTPTMIRI